MDDSDTIRGIAVKLLESKLKSENTANNSSRSIFILGAQRSGKTTLINVFFDRGENQTTETLGLEYTYGRKTVQGQLNEKNVCHVWELGGDTFRTVDILKIPLQAHKKITTTIVVFLDLSQPKTMWATLDKCVQSFRSIFGDDFPAPLIIIGGKYDVFSSFEISQKKFISKCLRSAAIILGASLVYFSKNDPTACKKIKDLFNHVGFGTEQKAKSSSSDYNKPLYILSGNDSWESLGSPRTSWDSLKYAYTGQFPQTELSMVVPDDPSLEAIYREPLIDMLRSQKDDELKLTLDRSIRTHF